MHVYMAECALAEALQRYGPGGVALAWNGGKESIVALHLLYERWCRAADHAQHTAPLLLVQLQTAPEFPEVALFLQETSTRYPRVVQQQYAGVTMRQCIEAFSRAHADTRAIVMGTRRSDPHGAALRAFSDTDAGWPPLVRVLPLLEWRYADVWRYMDTHALAYPALYARGYSSLGAPHNTRANPALRRADGTYAHARDLHDERLERAGRTDTR